VWRQNKTKKQGLVPAVIGALAVWQQQKKYLKPLVCVAAVDV